MFLLLLVLLHEYMSVQDDDMYGCGGFCADSDDSGCILGYGECAADSGLYEQEVGEGQRVSHQPLYY